MVDKARLEDLIGHTLAETEMGSIKSLNDVPGSLVVEARKLGSPILARELLVFYTPPEDWPFLKPFIDQVVFGEQPAIEWRRGGALVPAISLSDQLTLSKAAILLSIGGYAGVRTLPEFESWRAGASWVGAPAHPVPEATYRTVVPPGVARLAWPRLETVESESIVVQRWIAARLARVLYPKAPTSLDAILELAPSLPSVTKWSQDALIAVKALLREFLEFGAPESEIPGFRASTDWFEG
jgi:hypothetical protein